MYRARCAAFAICLTAGSLLTACSNGNSAAPASVPPGAVAPKNLQHIVVVIQENRSLDELFNGFCASTNQCANTVTVDPVTHTPLSPVSLAAPYSPDHSHSGFVTEYDNGKMDGWANVISACIGQPLPCKENVVAYVPHAETAKYFKLATVDGELSDATFQANSGPSLPAHLYAIAGQSGGYDSDRWALIEGNGSCANTQRAEQIDMTSAYPGTVGNPVIPCKDFQTIFDLLAKAGLSWRYYSNDPLTSFYSVTRNIQHLFDSPNFIVPPQQFLQDVANQNLPNVAFVMPEGNQSDHPTWVSRPSDGPDWVASVVNAVGESPYWNTSAIVVWWDDWGGWFDHVVPPRPSGEPAWMGKPDPFEYGFRVPFIVVSPYARIGHIDHTARSFVSTLRLIEKTFGLPQLGTLDQYEPDALDSMLDMNQRPIPYTPL